MDTLQVRSIDVMKLTKDVVNNQPSDAYIKAVVNLLATNFPLTHIAISVPLDSNGDLVTAGNKPAPRTIEQFTQAWTDAIHSAGLNVLFRGTFCATENIYNIPFAKLTPQQWYDKITNYVTKNPNIFKDSDIFAPFPESTNHAFDGNLFFDISTGTNSYASFFTGLKSSVDAAFKQIGKKVTTGLTTNNYSEISSGWIPRAIFDAVKTVVWDHYGVNHTPAEMNTNTRDTFAKLGYPIFQQEWGDYWNTTANTSYLKAMYDMWTQLRREGILMGFNYWGGWSGSGESIFIDNGNNSLSLNDKGKALQAFFQANAPVVTPTPTPVPTPTPPANILGKFDVKGSIEITSDGAGNINIAIKQSS